jgi:uncharacterized membrane protein
MTSDHTIDSPTTTTGTPPAPPATTRSGSTVLWVVLVLGVFANVTASAVLHNVYVSSATGLVVLACVAALVLRARAARHGA